MTITRRDFIATGVAVAAVAVLPVAAVAATPAAPTLLAENFLTEDDPWGAFVRGHVTRPEFESAMLHLIESNSDHRDNTEGWLWETDYGEGDEEDLLKVISQWPELSYMRRVEDHQERGAMNRRCHASEAGAEPITVVMY